MITTLDFRGVAGVVPRSTVAVAAIFCLAIVSPAHAINFQFNVLDASARLQ